MADARKVLFHLTDDALIVANSGKAFTRKGVIAICHMHLSEKTGKPVDNYDKDDLIRGIADSAIRMYRDHPNQFIASAGGEEALGADYKGRSIWELLQNADDAATLAALGIEGASGGQIGAKGLGFKSILEFSKSPEIYSGEFKFRFSREDTQKILRREEIQIGGDAPIFGIPHPCRPDKKCSSLLGDGYATVIRLPFIGGKAEKAEERLSELRATCLLFCQRLSRVEIEIRGKSRVIEINRGNIFGFKNGKATFTLKDGNDIRKWRRWSAAWTPKDDNAEAKKLSAALCLPIGKGGEISMDEESPVHVFFPTASDVFVPGLKALIHASYKLQSNREHFDNDKQPHGEAIHGKIGGLTADILKDIPASAALRAFGEIPAAKGNAATNEIKQLQNVFSNAVAQTPFVPVIGGGKVKPAEARIWRHRLGEVLRENNRGVREAKLLIPSLTAESDVRSILEKKLEANHVSWHEHAELLRSCRNDTLTECHAAWQVAGDIMSEASKIPLEQKEAVIDALKDASIWWTDAGIPRPLNGDIPLLQKRPKPQDWPDWLKADALSPEFRKLLTDKVRHKTDNPLTRHDSLKDAAVWPLHTPHSYFTGALLPFCEGKNSEWWEKMGWDVLQWAIRWGGDKTGESIIHLPTDKGWLPAIQCYAGKDWDGPASFDKYFQSVQDRGVILPIEKWNLPSGAENDKKKWGKFLCRLGVSWTPKVFIRDFVKLEESPPRLFEEYKEECLRYAQRMHRSACMITEGKCAFIEHFPESLLKCGPAQMLRAVRDVNQFAKEQGSITYRYSYRDRKILVQSFASFQLRQSEWVLCRPALLCPAGDNGKLRTAPKDALMPRHGMSILPEIIRGDIPNNEWHGVGGIEEMLRGLGVPEGWPDKPERFHMWMSDLAQYAGQLDEFAPARRWDIQGGEVNKQGEIAEAARLLFAAHFECFPDAPIPQDTPAPFLRKTTKGEFVDFAPARAIFHADKPYFAESNVRAKVLQEENIKVFPLFLNDFNAKRAGLAALSDKMNMRVVPPTERPWKETEELRSRYKDRRLLLVKAAGAALGKGVSLCKELEIWASEEIVMESSEYPDIRPEVDFWLPEGKKPPVLHVNTNGGQNRRWDSLAGGLAKLMGADATRYRAYFKNFLQEETKECLRMLRNDPFGLTEEALQELQDRLPLPGVNEGDGGLSPPSPPKAGNNGSVTEEPAPVNDDGRGQGGNSGRKTGNGQKGRGTRGGHGSPDPEQVKQVEVAAVNEVKKYYEKGEKYRVESVEDQRRGWDLEVFRRGEGGEKIWNVEVKGTSDNKISVILTPNEYDKSDDEMYRLAVVRNALDGDARACAIYKREGDEWRLKDGSDKDAPKRLVMEKSATVKEPRTR